MFQASIHGWPFGNDYECSGSELGTGGPPPPDLGMGGGLCWSALDRYVRGVAIPRDTEAPAPGDPLHAELYQRQVAAIAGIWPQIREWHYRPEGSWRDRLPFPIPGGDDLASRTRRSWRQVRQSLADGVPVLLTLLPDTGGYERPHAVKQVLATAVSREGPRARITVYDPSRPGNDRVHVKLNLAGPLEARTSDGTALRGFFPVAYDRKPGGVVRLQSFDERAVIGLNRTVRGRLSGTPGRNRLDLVGRNERGALIHFHRRRSVTWESANVTESQDFGAYELHSDPVAVRTGGALHVFGLDYLGDLLHFRLRRSWSVWNRTDHKRVGPRFQLQGRVAAVPGPKLTMSVLGRDDNGGLVHYHHSPLHGWRAEQVPGDPVATDPTAGWSDDTLHVVSADEEGRVIHWRRRTEWTMTDTDAGDDGPRIRLAGAPRLLIRNGIVRVIGRTTEGELAIMTLGQDGRWRRTRLGRDLAGDPGATEGPAGLHLFAPAGRRGLVHVWQEDAEWVWEDIMDTRPALQENGSGVPQLACWGSRTEIRVFERRRTNLRVLSWHPDSDWVSDPISSQAGAAPTLFRDHESDPHVVLTDRWGNVLHVEKGEWQEPRRPGPTPVPSRPAADEVAMEEPAEAIPEAEPTTARAAAPAATELEMEPDTEPEPELEEPVAELDLVTSLEPEELEEPATGPEPAEASPGPEPVEIVASGDVGEPDEDAASGFDDIERFGDIRDEADEAVEEPVASAEAEAEEVEPVAAPEPQEPEPMAAAEEEEEDEEEREPDALDELFEVFEDFDPVDNLGGAPESEEEEDSPLLEPEEPEPTTVRAEAAEEDDDFPFLDFEDDDPEPAPEAEATPAPEDPGDGDLASLETQTRGRREDLPFLDDDEDPVEEDLPVVAEKEKPATEEESAPPASGSRVIRRVKGGPAGPGGAVDVEPMDLSLLDSWPDTSSDRRKKRGSKAEKREGPNNGGSSSSSSS